MTSEPPTDHADADADADAATEPTVTAADLVAQIEAGHAPVVLDVRTAQEYATGHVPGAVHMPFWTLPVRVGELRKWEGRTIVVYCGYGPRAAMARSVLRAFGFRQVACLAGHMAGWRRAGLPTRTS